MIFQTLDAIQIRLLKNINKADELSKKVTLNNLINTAASSKISFDGLKKQFGKCFWSRNTLTSNETKDIIKVIQSLENREILLKGTTRKITSQVGGFLNFLRTLMTAGLPLMKSVLTPLAKSVLLPLGLSAQMQQFKISLMDKEAQH